MKVDCHSYRVADRSAAGHATRPTSVKPIYKSGKQYRKLIEKIAELTAREPHRRRRYAATVSKEKRMAHRK